jgi:hypothetical protein
MAQEQRHGTTRQNGYRAPLLLVRLDVHADAGDQAVARWNSPAE